MRSIIENIKEYSVVVFVSISFIALITLLLQSTYTPIRLYFTGESISMEVYDKKPDYSNGRHGSTYNGQFILTKEAPRKIYVATKEHYDEIKLNEVVNVFYSKELQEGILTRSKNPSLISCIIHIKGYISLIFTIIGYIILFRILIYALVLNYKEFESRFQELNLELLDKEPDIYNQSKLRYYLFFSQKLMPDLVIISFIYFLSIISIKTILLTENMGEFIVGFVLLTVIISVAFFPLFTLKIRKSFSSNNSIKMIISTVKIITGSYGIYKTILFVNTMETFNPTNSTKIAIDYFKFIFSF